ncbi:MAG TPA: metal-sensitive transcriptional regulator [Firmicutes bacterium]|nr:metal-sensitive transcriptional regulator [Bacillota bacterium]
MEQAEGFGTELRSEVISRLRRIEGQVRGIQRMIEEERSCREVILQLAAVKSAVVQVAMTILSHEMVDCLARKTGSEQDREGALDRFMELFKKFS